MGLLTMGTPLPWEKAKQHRDYVRNHGIDQFLALYYKSRDIQNDSLLWGDEVSNTSWKPEYGRYMLEGTPGKPYGSSLSDLIQVEPNMKLRREIAEKHLEQNEVLITLTSFPRLGQGQFLEPHHEPTGPISRSLFVPDEIINPHARFPTLTANIRKRRGSKVAINMPIYHDKKTPKPFIDPTIPRDRNLYPEDSEAAEGAAFLDHIYMDSMVFGMGCSCLQITFQACNIDEARRLYDHLATMSPIMLALTAAAPIYRGYLSDVDCRWNVIACSVDDRTKEERDLEPLKKDRFVINKSRYDSIDCYISTEKILKPEYNDLNLVYDKKIWIDELLARHISHLFIRDPLVIFEELLDQDDHVSSDHFENIQSTNWQTMRFKPPPPNSNIGWRVEFRSMEIQITDFENAAFAVFIVLLARVILNYRLNFYIPISKVDENMGIAHRRNAVLSEKFWFRRNIIQGKLNHSNNSINYCLNGHSTNINGTSISIEDEDEDEHEKMTINEIINGKDAKFTGLITLIFQYLNSVDIDISTKHQLEKYLEFIKLRAKGEIQTEATWIRNFVQSHPKYKCDSVVSQEINYDLIKMVEKIQKGEVNTPELLGNG
ncbi:10153_t:CDS:10 [Diversispora eburnea]|uniref:Glutamate--cysteine ligase n=1 Tax=Diversispora eburnea TaxID=1213867 RepID=A0A9N9CCP0_9GLOM|nr:10153_t:CDS:10 [Diversispora eburnea]